MQMSTRMMYHCNPSTLMEALNIVTMTIEAGHGSLASAFHSNPLERLAHGKEKSDSAFR